MERITLMAIMRHVRTAGGQAQPVRGYGRQVLPEGLICCDKVTCLAAEGKAVAGLCLGLTEALDTVSHSISWRNWLLLAGPGGSALGWPSQRAAGDGVPSCWCWAHGVSPGLSAGASPV